MWRRQKLGPLYFLCNLCEASHRMGKMVRAKCLSPFSCFGGNEKPTRPIVTFVNHSRDHLQIQTHCEVSRFAVSNETCSTHWGDFYNKASEQSTGSEDNSDSEDHWQQAENADWDMTFVANCSSSESNLLTQGDLKDIVLDLNLSKNDTNS